MVALKVKIDDEAMRTLGAIIRGHLYEVAAAEGVSHIDAKRFGHLLRHVLADFAGDIFECVTHPAAGTRNYVVGLRIDRTLKRKIALRAFNTVSRHDAFAPIQGRSVH